MFFAAYAAPRPPAKQREIRYLLNTNMLNIKTLKVDIYNSKLEDLS